MLTRSFTPAWWLLATVLGGVLSAVLAAAVPARLPTATAPGRALRAE